MARSGKHSDFDVIIVGSGAAGASAAHVLAAAQKQVAIVEGVKVGGNATVNAYTAGGVLRNIARSYLDTKDNEHLGLRTSALGYNYPTVHAVVKSITERAGVAADPEVLEQAGISIVRGRAIFTGPNTISVDGHELSAEKFIIATGASEYIPPVMGLKEVGYLTTEQLVAAQALPKSIAIVGGGATSVEITEVLRAFGTKTTIFERGPHLMPDFDHHIGKLLTTLLRRRGINIITSTHRMQVTKNGSKKRIEFINADGESSVVEADEILLASGRRANLDLGLDSAGVDFEDSGIVVNQYMQTSAKNIWAAGDVVNTDHHAHSSSRQGQIAAHNILHRAKLEFNEMDIPRVIFSSPEAATVGLSEQGIIDQGIKYDVGASAIKSTDRAMMDTRDAGFVKIIASKKGHILGASIVAPRAGEMIHEIALAMKVGASAEDLADLTHAAATYSHAIQLAAGKL